MGNSQHHELIYSRSTHHQALETMAARALADKDFVAAFKFADRRCRIDPPALAHCYVLRAEAAYRTGDPRAALADLATALEISPQDTAALRRLLAWGNDSERQLAASSLIAEEQDFGTLRAAIKELALGGRRRLAAATVFDEYVAGWAVWDTDEVAELSMMSEMGSLSFLLSPDPFHPLSSHLVRASAFRIPRQQSQLPQMISISLQGETFFSRRMAPNAQNHNVNSVPSGPDRALVPPDRRPTVIVPVYADVVATKACIDGLLADNPSGKSYRLIVVDDASPEPELSAYLRSLPRKPHLEILTNPMNLGFIGSVNRALSRLRDGDVVLLNADTLVPPGFVDRLAAAAKLSQDIGTVVPLSNNSAISDFPIPNHNNPFGTRKNVILLDGVAATCNRGVTVEIPNGTGFCLYVNRACLDAVGGLSESFHRGYLEDIDFCLRARERGFRSVCAPSVYVGHAGSRSFKAEKRSLVLRNLDVLDRRFPLFRGECAAFVAMDPLRPARQAIEMVLPKKGRPTLLVTGVGALKAVAQERAHQLLLEGKSTILLQMISEDGERKVLFSATDHATPQSLCFAFSSENDMAALRKYLRELRPSHCEIVDLAVTPPLLVQTFAEMNLPFDLWIADGTIARMPAAPPQSKPERRAPKSKVASARKFASDYGKTDPRKVATAARHILVACDKAAAFARQNLQGLNAKVVKSPPKNPIPLTVQRDHQRPRLLAIVPTRSSATEFRTIQSVAVLLHRRKLQTSIVVAGSTLDDVRLMSLENVFVTGLIAPSELGFALRAHNVGWMLTGFDEPLFGHPLLQSVLGSNVPVAYVDWSTGHAPKRPGDLAIDPGLRSDQAASEVVSWIEGS